MLLYENLYERGGNDSWLEDLIIIHNSPMGLYLEHKVKYTGWQGEIKESYTIDLSKYALTLRQEQIDNYLRDKGLLESFTINLEELLVK